ncbi:MAG: PIG-L family deacetylase [Acidobacteriia bacterium]|nr:PIG-L family deacetylase [Terriglobia bacterium]
MKRRDFIVTGSLALAASGGVGSAAKPNLPSDTKLRILAISAHPADFCSRTGGTLIKQVRAGCPVRVIWLTRGETDESSLLYQKHPGISTEEVRRIREKEAFAAAEVLGVEGRMLGFSDHPLDMTPERMDKLAQEMADFKPDIILTHFKDELTYPTHWRTAQSVIRAAQLAGVSWDIRFFEPTIGTANRVGFIPDDYVDITDVFDQKVTALKELATQPDLIPHYTVCNQWRGLECDRAYAEAFVHWAPRVPVASTLSR